MRLRVVSDGTPRGTVVRNADTDEILHGVTAVEWSVSVGGIATAHIAVTLVAVDVVGEEVPA